MVSEDGQALLIFGVAALINALFLPAAMSLRRPANWASPEELESGKFVKAPEADVWAFGMTALVCNEPYSAPCSFLRRNSLPANHHSTVLSLRRM